MLSYLQKHGRVILNANLKKYNTYQVETTAHYLVFPFKVSDLIAILSFLKEHQICYFIIGNGSNLVLPDSNFDGVVIKLTYFNQIDIHSPYVMAEAGVSLPKLVKETIDHGLAGLEWAMGIPGTIGGSVVGNAGAYNSCIFDSIVEVKVLTADLEIKILPKTAFKSDYRYTILKTNKDLIVLAVKLKLTKGNRAKSLSILADRLQRRQASQPLDCLSAGSVFRNPPNDSAGRIIESLHLKNYRLGGAEISGKHANFIINVDRATGQDIRNLIKLVHARVLAATNIDLIIEQEFIDWESLHEKK